MGGGGFYAFDDDPAVNPTIATDLQGAGYRTALIGKYLNKYPGRDELVGTSRPAGTAGSLCRPGRTTTTSPHPTATGGGSATHPGDYSTQVLTSRAADFIHETSATGTPFFLYLALTAPHGPPIAYPQDVGRFDAYVDALPITPHPSASRTSPTSRTTSESLAWTRELQDGYDAFHARQLSAIYGVDRAVGRIWDTLPDNTVVLYMSDNGYEWGEHRWEQKIVPYNESIRVPMILATKGLGMPSIDPGRIALNVDIRATLGSFAGLSPTTKGHAWTDPSWSRKDFVLEHWD